MSSHRHQHLYQGHGDDKSSSRALSESDQHRPPDPKSGKYYERFESDNAGILVSSSSAEHESESATFVDVEEEHTLSLIAMHSTSEDFSSDNCFDVNCNNECCPPYSAVQHTGKIHNAAACPSPENSSDYSSQSTLNALEEMRHLCKLMRSCVTTDTNNAGSSSHHRFHNPHQQQHHSPIEMDAVAEASLKHFSKVCQLQNNPQFQHSPDANPLMSLSSTATGQQLVQCLRQCFADDNFCELFLTSAMNSAVQRIIKSSLTADAPCQDAMSSSLPHNHQPRDKTFRSKTTSNDDRLWKKQSSSRERVVKVETKCRSIEETILKDISQGGETKPAQRIPSPPQSLLPFIPGDIKRKLSKPNGKQTQKLSHQSKESVPPPVQPLIQQGNNPNGISTGRVTRTSKANSPSSDSVPSKSSSITLDSCFFRRKSHSKDNSQALPSLPGLPTETLKYGKTSGLALKLISPVVQHSEVPSEKVNNAEEATYPLLQEERVFFNHLFNKRVQLQLSQCSEMAICIALEKATCVTFCGLQFPLDCLHQSVECLVTALPVCEYRVNFLDRRTFQQLLLTNKMHHYPPHLVQPKVLSLPTHLSIRRHRCHQLSCFPVLKKRKRPMVAAATCFQAVMMVPSSEDVLQETESLNVEPYSLTKATESTISELSIPTIVPTEASQLALIKCVGMKWKLDSCVPMVEGTQEEGCVSEFVGNNLITEVTTPASSNVFWLVETVCQTPQSDGDHEQNKRISPCQFTSLFENAWQECPNCLTPSLCSVSKKFHPEVVKSTRPHCIFLPVSVFSKNNIPETRRNLSDNDVEFVATCPDEEDLMPTSAASLNRTIGLLDHESYSTSNNVDEVLESTLECATCSRSLPAADVPTGKELVQKDPVIEALFSDITTSDESDVEDCSQSSQLEELENSLGFLQSEGHHIKHDDKVAKNVTPSEIDYTRSPISLSSSVEDITSFT